jgi:hypothetical protein
MKTTKLISKPEKPLKGKETAKRKKVTTSIPWPGEEDIREKAMEIYIQRMSIGEHRTADEDWLEAEKSLRNSK